MGGELLEKRGGSREHSSVPSACGWIVAARTADGEYGSMSRSQTLFEAASVSAAKLSGDVGGKVGHPFIHIAVQTDLLGVILAGAGI